MAAASPNDRTPERSAARSRPSATSSRRRRAAPRRARRGDGRRRQAAREPAGRGGRRARRRVLPRGRDRRHDALPRPPRPRTLSLGRLCGREADARFARRDPLADPGARMGRHGASSARSRRSSPTTAWASRPDRVQLAARVLPGGDLPRRPARPGRRLRRRSGSSSPRRAGRRARHDRPLQQDSSTATSVVAFVVGAAGATWAASGAMNAVIKAVNRAYDLVETRPFWKTRLIAIVLVGLTGLVLAGLLLLIVFGGPLGTAIADGAGWATPSSSSGRSRAGRSPSSPSCSSSRSSTTWRRTSAERRWQWLSPGALVGSLSGSCSRRCSRSTRVLGLVLEDLRRARERHRAPALAELLRVRAPLRRRAQLRARPRGGDPRGRTARRRLGQAEPPATARKVTVTFAEPRMRTPLRGRGAPSVPA